MTAVSVFRVSVGLLIVMLLSPFRACLRDPSFNNHPAVGRQYWDITSTSRCFNLASFGLVTYLLQRHPIMEVPGSY